MDGKGASSLKLLKELASLLFFSSFFFSKCVTVFM